MTELIKNYIYRVIAFFLLLLSLPLFLVLFLLIRLTSSGPFLFKQKRIGKDKKSFIMYKIRTMIENAQGLKNGLRKLNEADGPVFKIRDDPRYTKIGKFLAHTGLDELPQLINIVKGEMSFVGPRPLPADETGKIPKKYERRFSVLPGITSLWVIHGSHKLAFDEWMKLDLRYIDNRSLWLDMKISFLTVAMIVKFLARELINI